MVCPSRLADSLPAKAAAVEVREGVRAREEVRVKGKVLVVEMKVASFVLVNVWFRFRARHPQVRLPFPP